MFLLIIKTYIFIVIFMLNICQFEIVLELIVHLYYKGHILVFAS